VSFTLWHMVHFLELIVYLLVFTGPQPMEVIEISSDMARSIASGAGSWSPG